MLQLQRPFDRGGDVLFSDCDVMLGGGYFLLHALRIQADNHEWIWITALRAFSQTRYHNAGQAFSSIIVRLNGALDMLGACMVHAGTCMVYTWCMPGACM